MKKIRGRPKGSKNSSKFFAVKLSDLMKVFKDDSLINIDKSYSFLFDGSPNQVIFEPQALDKDKIDLKVIRFDAPKHDN